QVLFDGFFPATKVDELPGKGARTGLHEMGLPYVSDAGITRHLAAFLHAQQPAPPDAILFNGGVFTPQPLRDRLLEVMRGWYGQAWHPLVLTNPSLDLAVAWGSAFFGWLRHTGGKRIGGGIPRSYYVAIEGPSKPEAQARESDATVLCVVPQHLEEGQEIAL